MTLPTPGDPEYGYFCPRCRAATTMVNTSFVECCNARCDWNSDCRD